MKSYRDSARARKNVRQGGVDPKPVGGTAKRDTKRWCGGKVGREHDPKCYRRHRSHWYDLCCSVCGKQLDYWIDWSDTCWGEGVKQWQKPKPTWVTE